MIEITYLDASKQERTMTFESTRDMIWTTMGLTEMFSSIS